MFPIMLTAIGLGMIYLGIVWQKNEQVLTGKAKSILPTHFQNLLEGRS